MMKIKLIAPHDQREDTLEMMTGFPQTLARILPLYDVNGGFRASMILGIMTTTWSEEAT